MSLLEKGKSPLGQSYLMSRVWALWPQWMPSSIAKSTQPLAIKGGVLFILVKNSAWIYELNFNKQALLEKVQKEIGQEVVNEIRFTLDPKTLPRDILLQSEMRDFILHSTSEKKTQK